jgi:tetratricopeptide (TPR) repeat protein
MLLETVTWGWLRVLFFSLSSFHAESAFHNLGLLYADQGKLQKAEDMYLRALRGYEKAIGSRNIINIGQQSTLYAILGPYYQLKAS